MTLATEPTNMTTSALRQSDATVQPSPGQPTVDHQARKGRTVHNYPTQRPIQDKHSTPNEASHRRPPRPPLALQQTQLCPRQPSTVSDRTRPRSGQAEAGPGGTPPQGFRVAAGPYVSQTPQGGPLTAGPGARHWAGGAPEPAKQERCFVSWQAEQRRAQAGRRLRGLTHPAQETADRHKSVSSQGPPCARVAQPAPPARRVGAPEAPQLPEVASAPRRPCSHSPASACCSTAPPLRSRRAARGAVAHFATHQTGVPPTAACAPPAAGATLPGSRCA